MRPAPQRRRTSDIYAAVSLKGNGHVGLTGKRIRIYVERKSGPVRAFLPGDLTEVTGGLDALQRLTCERALTKEGFTVSA